MSQWCCVPKGETRAHDCRLGYLTTLGERVWGGEPMLLKPNMLLCTVPLVLLGKGGGEDQILRGSASGGYISHRTFPSGLLSLLCQNPCFHSCRTEHFHHHLSSMTGRP